MIKVENIETWGFEHAIRGMRNPLNSWERSDSQMMWVEDPSYNDIGRPDLAMGMVIGENDLTLMRKLYAAGQPHRKYLRQIFVSMDITAPLYWWKEFDTYKVGTTANSCSTMHKIAAKEFTLDDFSSEHLMNDVKSAGTELVDTAGLGTDIVVTPLSWLNITIGCLNNYRKMYVETKDKNWWWQMIQLLPSSYNQRRTVTMSYENVINILDYRQGHKLDEWNEYCKILLELPHVAEIRETTQKG